MRASSDAHVPQRFICPAPSGVGERPGAAGYGISTSGSARTLVLRSLKPLVELSSCVQMAVATTDNDCPIAFVIRLLQVGSLSSNLE